MTNHCRWWVGTLIGRAKLDLTWDRINRESCVMVTASECGPGGTSEGGRVNNDRFLGSARFTVNNIAPYDGGVSFRVTVEWDEPLETYVDVTVFDDASDNWTFAS